MELKKTARIDLLKERMLSQPRYVSMEQDVYKRQPESCANRKKVREKAKRDRCGYE